MFAYNCTSCHGPGIGNPGNEFKPGTDALRVKYNGDVPALLTERTDLTPDAVAYFVRNGISIMPFFRKTEISDADLPRSAPISTGTAPAGDMRHGGDNSKEDCYGYRERAAPA